MALTKKHINELTYNVIGCAAATLILQKPINYH